MVQRYEMHTVILWLTKNSKFHKKVVLYKDSIFIRSCMSIYFLALRLRTFGLLFAPVSI